MDAFSLNYALFSQACAKASHLHPNSGPTLVRRHRRGAPPATSKDMQDTMQLILAQFKCYLGLLPFYQSLAEEDQASLLARNSKLYLMFVLGRYFSALSGQEQLLWILGEDDPQVKGSSSLGMETVFIPFQSLSVPGAAGNMFEVCIFHLVIFFAKFFLPSLLLMLFDLFGTFAEHISGWKSLAGSVLQAQAGLSSAAQPEAPGCPTPFLCL